MRMQCTLHVEGLSVGPFSSQEAKVASLMPALEYPRSQQLIQIGDNLCTGCGLVCSDWHACQTQISKACSSPGTCALTGSRASNAMLRTKLYSAKSPTGKFSATVRRGATYSRANMAHLNKQGLPTVISANSSTVACGLLMHDFTLCMLPPPVLRITENGWLVTFMW